jgi:signal transduction histidine kinase
MEQRALEPGLLLTFRGFVVFSAILPVLAMRQMAPVFGMREPPFKAFQVNAWTFVFLIVYTTWPWCRRRMGRVFLPVALIVKAIEPIAGGYLLQSEFVPPAYWEYFALTNVVRLLLHSEWIVIFTAWQYELVWPLIAGVAQCALTALIFSPYVNAAGPLYPLYAAIMITQFATLTGTGVVLGLLMRSQRRQAAALDERNRKLAEYASAVEQLAITQERNRLARELHDTLAHSLSAVAVQIEAAQALSEIDAAGGQKMLDQALQSTRNGLTEARRSVHALRASPLQDLGLSLAVRDLAESAAARAGLKLNFYIGSQLENLGPEVEQCLYRMAQEALTNVARHARATSVEVALARENGRVRLTVTDNGRGFDPATVGGTRLGLKGLRERAETVGGALLVESEKDRGTRVALEIATSERTT